MTWVRVFHKLDGEIVARDHRADEPVSGSDVYTDGNVPPTFSGLDWFVCDIQDFYEGEGEEEERKEVPWGTASVTNAGLSRGLRGVLVDTAGVAAVRKAQDTREARLAALQAKLVDGTATTADMRELMRLERGL